LLALAGRLNFAHQPKICVSVFRWGERSVATGARHWPATSDKAELSLASATHLNSYPITLKISINRRHGDLTVDHLRWFHGQQMERSSKYKTPHPDQLQV